MQQSWQVLGERSPAGSYARRRAAALTAAGLFFVGLAAVLGFGRLLLLAFAAGLALAGATGGARLLRRHRPWRHAPAAIRRVARELRSLRSRTARPTVLDATLQRAAGRARRGLAAMLVVARRYGRDLRPVVERLVARARLPRLAPGMPRPSDRERHAIELNVHGARLRREGAYEQAARQHEAALEIFRELGDRQSEALTLNNVALAEGRAGDEHTAVAHFEEALAILRELADREHEAQVTANLGITLRRHGHDDRAKELLETALGQLEPESAAARQLEVQLRRAS